MTFIWSLGHVGKVVIYKENITLTLIQRLVYFRWMKMCLKALKCRKWTFLGYSISPPFDSSIISIICCSQRLRMNFHAQILTKLDLISDWSHSIEPEAGLLVWNMLTGKNSCKLHVGPQCCDYLLMLFRFTHTQSLGMHSHALPHPGGCTQWVCSTPAMTTT